MGIVYLEGGPNDGQAYETKDLLGLQSLSIPINEYVWTSERRTSERTGAVAQIWKHRDLVGSAAPSTPAEPVPATVPSAVPAPIEEPVVLTGPADAVAATRYVDAADTGAVAPQDTGIETPSDQSEAVSDDPVAIGEELMRRRKALKLSVSAIGDRAGLARSKVDSIEKGTGKRIKPDEIQAVMDAVAAFEAERGGASAR